MKIDKPYNYSEYFRRSMFANSPRLMMVSNGFFPGVPPDFLQYKNSRPMDKRPEVLV